MISLNWMARLLPVTNRHSYGWWSLITTPFLALTKSQKYNEAFSELPIVFLDRGRLAGARVKVSARDIAYNAA